MQPAGVSCARGFLLRRGTALRLIGAMPLIRIDRPSRPQPGSLSRRRFIKLGASTAAFTAASWDRVLGANDRVGVGMIGCGLIGRIHTRSFMAQPDVHIVAVAETYRPRLEAAAELIGGNVSKYGDFRTLLENKAIDAVVVATPDHWHGPTTACALISPKTYNRHRPMHSLSCSTRSQSNTLAPRLLELEPEPAQCWASQVQIPGPKASCTIAALALACALSSASPADLPAQTGGQMMFQTL